MTSKTASHPLSDFSKASENLAKNLSYESFDPVLYVKSVSARIDGDQELEEEKLKITKLSDETAQILKKQVYNNYLQFIDTAKEISNLEQEMKQINQILAKQKDVMDRMSKVLVSDSGVDMEAKMKEQEATKEREDKEEQQVKALSTILEKVEDCDPNLIKAGRFLVFDGRVAELEAENFQPFQEVHLFLLNDALLLATHDSIYQNTADTLRRPRTGTDDDYKRFKFNIMYSLKDLAIVNARDIGGMRNSFKILSFPEHRVFQCTDNNEKRKWLDVLDSTKRRFMTVDEETKLAAGGGLERMDSVSGQPGVPGDMRSRAGSVYKAQTPGDNSPFGLESPMSGFDEVESGGNQKLDVGWLQDAIEEFDVFVAQRQFREACELIVVGIEYLRDKRAEVNHEHFKEWGLQFAKRRTELVTVLRTELTIQTTSRMQRLPAELLVKLYDTRRAVQLFLKARSCTIRGLKPHTGSALQHIQRLSSQTFALMAETIRDFSEIFQEMPQQNALLITYFIVPEIDNFCEQFKQTVFSGGRSRLTFQESSECYDISLSEFEKRIEKIDMNFYIGAALRQEVVECIKLESRNVVQFFEARLADETWQTLKDTEKTKEVIQKYVPGIRTSEIQEYVTENDDASLEIAATVVVLAKQLGIFVDGTCKFLDVETMRVVQGSVVDVWKGVLVKLKGAVKCLDNGSQEYRIARRSYEFMKELILPKFADSLCEFGFDGGLLYF